MNLLNLDHNDPFNMEVEGEKGEEKIIQGPVHIRVFQRTSRKYITSIEGLARDLNLKKIVKYMCKEFHCNGAVIKKEDKKNPGKKIKYIQLQGQQKQHVFDFLVDEKICPKEIIKMHGF